MPSGSLTRGASATSTPLADLLAQRIRARGPITYAEWMAAALYHPRHGYYRRGRPTVGRAGDFLTSPEVHPIFGAATAQLVSSVAVLVAREAARCRFESSRSAPARAPSPNRCSRRSTRRSNSR